MQKSKLLITGGAGFIGSAFVRLLVNKGYRPVVVDKFTYAGDRQRLKEAEGRYKLYKADICDRKRMDEILEKECPQALVNFAAETHVDRSILDSRVFLKTNAAGTQVMLDAAMKYGVKRFVHISTDEVYGEIEKGKFTEDSPLKPNSPYAASKAAADLLVRSYARTYSFAAIIVRPCNNYGPWQYPEKLIPLAVSMLLKGGKIPIYGNGRNVREWLYVEDCAQAIFSVMAKGRPGGVYNLGSGEEKRNIDVAGIILRALGKDGNAVRFVKDRPGHDLRYRLDSSRLTADTGWRADHGFERKLESTIGWCCRNKEWLLKKLKNIPSSYRKEES